MLILNSNTPDEAVAGIAQGCSKRAAEIVGANQLRLLRHEDIIRQLAKNPNADGALIDGVCDFAVRSGVKMPDVPQVQQARAHSFVRARGHHLAAGRHLADGRTVDRRAGSGQRGRPARRAARGGQEPHALAADHEDERVGEDQAGDQPSRSAGRS